MLELNLTGLNCPLPVLKTKKFLANLESGCLVQVITSDPASLVDLEDFCTKTGHILISQETTNNLITSVIKRR
ncbi:MAG: hypothetical protein RLZZ293_324 [Pseudomonadota bacterium]|jgi:tRNA 2-thiouridine synthesizing protein A